MWKQQRKRKNTQSKDSDWKSFRIHSQFTSHCLWISSQVQVIDTCALSWMCVLWENDFSVTWVTWVECPSLVLWGVWNYRVKQNRWHTIKPRCMSLECSLFSMSPRLKECQNHADAVLLNKRPKFNTPQYCFGDALIWHIGQQQWRNHLLYLCVSQKA